MLQLARSAQRSPLPLPSLTRTYVVSVKPPRVYPQKPVPRIYNERKQFLYNQYIRLLETSSKSPLIFLQHNKFSIARLTKLRKDIAAATSRGGGFAPSLLNPGPTPFAPSTDPNVATPPSLTVLRTSIFGVALRDYAPLDTEVTQDIADTVEGGLAVLSLPTFDPPQLSAIIRALQRSAPPPKNVPSVAEAAEKKQKADDASFVPGRRSKRVRATHAPELSLMGALIEGRVFKAPQVHEVATLPSLDTLHAQLVGLLSAPSTQLAAVLSQASGGQLARTLEGFQKGLEEQQVDEHL